MLSSLMLGFSLIEKVSFNEIEKRRIKAILLQAIMGVM